MNSKQYDDLVADVRLTCTCTEDEAKYIITLCTRLKADPYEFIKKLPGLVGKVTLSADEVINEMESIAKTHGVTVGGVTMPKGYENRAARRRAKRKGCVNYD